MLSRASPRGTVLLAEDDGQMRRLLAAELREQGWAVIEAFDGHDLMDLIAAWHYPGTHAAPVAAIVSDVRMPGYSGLQVLEALRGTHRPIPVVLVTGFGDEELHARVHDLGGAALLDKPVEPGAVAEAVARLKGRP